MSCADRKEPLKYFKAMTELINLSFSYCAVCEFPKKMNLTMRGLCSTGKIFLGIYTIQFIQLYLLRRKTDGGIF